MGVERERFKSSWWMEVVKNERENSMVGSDVILRLTSVMKTILNFGRTCGQGIRL